MNYLKSSTDIYKYISNDKNVVIYGAGNYGRILYWYLYDILKSKKEIMVAVTNSDEDNIGISEVLNQKNYIVIIAASNLNAHEMLEVAAKQDFAAIGIMTEDLYAELICKKRELNYSRSGFYSRIEEQEKRFLRFQKQPRFEYMVLNILNHCNLRCKGCDHFACIAEPYLVSYEAIEKEIIRISEITKGHITKIGIMGGEPLLHPELLKILACVRAYFPNTILRLTSNGILMNQQKQEFWDVCRENKIVLVVTKYPLKTDYKKMEEIARKNNVQFEYYQGTGGDAIKTSCKKTINPKGDNNPVESFYKCDVANYGNFLMEGKMYCCPFVGSAHIFNEKFGDVLEVTEEDYIDIYSPDITYDNLLEFSARAHQFCRYCDVDRRDYGLKWEITKQTPYEWLIEEGI